MSQRLTALTTASTLDVGASLAALQESQGDPKLQAATDPQASSLACRLSTSTPPKSKAYDFAFRLVLTKQSPEVWPCSAAETNTIWRRFKRYFDEEVEIRTQKKENNEGFHYFEGVKNHTGSAAFRAKILFDNFS